MESKHRSVAGWLGALRGAIVLTVVCGGIYPLVATSLGSLLFPFQATGSLIDIDGRTVGSTLVGQPFRAAGYFHGRPSACGYDPTAMAGSNLAPSNPALRARALRTARAISQRDGAATDRIPVDLVAASGSGIDPDISPAAALLQVTAVAQARGLPPSRVRALVERHIQPPQWGILGEPRVDVLPLNLALDRLGPSP